MNNIQVYMKLILTNVALAIENDCSFPAAEKLMKQFRSIEVATWNVQVFSQYKIQITKAMRMIKGAFNDFVLNAAGKEGV